MSKPIRLTAEHLSLLQAEFISALKGMKMFDGKISYTKDFRWSSSDDDKAIVTFSPIAFAKMVMLIQNFDSEVAWHGVVHRDQDIQNIFNITDILVYPQVVTGSTVNTDQAEYTKWLYEQDDDVFNAIRMQGHSHVNFSTSPSAVDTEHQSGILSQLDDDMFYIFMIWNKKFEYTTKIFDLKNNTLYEDDDIDVLICENGVNLDEFMKGAKSIVKNKPQAPPYYSSQQVGRVIPATTYRSPTASAGSTKQKPKERSGVRGTTDDFIPDHSADGYPYGSYYERFYR